jgi:hypothetical protein
MALTILSSCFSINTKADGEEGDLLPFRLEVHQDDAGKCYGHVFLQNNDQYNTITSDFKVKLFQDSLEGRYLGEVNVTENLSPSEEYTAIVDDDGWTWAGGCHKILGFVDSEDNVSETDEENNVIEGNFIVIKDSFYFNTYDTSETPEQWEYNPSYMANGASASYASTTIAGDVELLNGNTCTGLETGNITNVWIRTKGYYSTNKHTITLTPKYNGELLGDDYEFDDITTSATWSPWFEITEDRCAPETWTWYDIDNLDIDVTAENTMSAFTLYCSQVEIQVGYVEEC